MLVPFLTPRVVLFYSVVLAKNIVCCLWSLNLLLPNRHLLRLACVYWSVCIFSEAKVRVGVIKPYSRQVKVCNVYVTRDVILCHSLHIALRRVTRYYREALSAGRQATYVTMATSNTPYTITFFVMHFELLNNQQNCIFSKPWRCHCDLLAYNLDNLTWTLASFLHAGYLNIWRTFHNKGKYNNSETSLTLDISVVIPVYGRDIHRQWWIELCSVCSNHVRTRVCRVMIRSGGEDWTTLQPSFLLTQWPSAASSHGGQSIRSQRWWKGRGHHSNAQRHRPRHEE